MRWILFIVIGFVLIFGFAFVTSYEINETAQSVQDQLHAAEKYVLAEQWHEAVSQLESADKEWRNMKKWWGMLLNNNVITGIDISLKRIEQYVVAKEQGDSLAELYSLIILLDDVSYSQTLRAVNIL